MKKLYMAFTILHTTEVPDDYTNEEAYELAQEFADEAGFGPLCSDIEVEVGDCE